MTESIIAWMTTILIGYLLGSVNSAILVTRLLKKEDIRLKGSKNAGMTNVLRVYGRMAALLTFLGDGFKAVLAVLLSRWIFTLLSIELAVDPGYVAGLFVILGHIFPLYFKFKGGKGVMPAFAVILLVNPIVFIVLLAVAVIVFLVTRTMSRVSLISALLFPVLTGLCSWFWQSNFWYETLLAVAYSLLVMVAHRENIRRLHDRTEKPIWPRTKNL
jgi:acyl phosphate:glycerol-3-phosphate acyltransferase